MLVARILLLHRQDQFAVAHGNIYAVRQFGGGETADRLAINVQWRNAAMPYQLFPFWKVTE